MISQTLEIMHRGMQKRAGKRLSIKSVLLALDKQDEETYITKDPGSSRKSFDDREPKLIVVSTFTRLVAGLTPVQAERLIGNAIDLREASDSKAGDISDCLTHLNSLNLRMQYIQQVAESTENVDVGVAGIEKMILNTLSDMSLSKKETTTV